MATLIKPDGSTKTVQPANKTKFTNEELFTLLDADAVYTFVATRKFALVTADVGSDNPIATLRARIGGIERNTPIWGSALFCAEKELP